MKARITKLITTDTKAPNPSTLAPASRGSGQRRAGRHLARKHDVAIGKVDIAEDRADNRHDDLVGQRLDDPRNAPPIITATASSITLPLAMKALNSDSMLIPLMCCLHSSDSLAGACQAVRFCLSPA